MTPNVLHYGAHTILARTHVALWWEEEFHAKMC